MKITFLGAGSTVFAKNVLGDCMLTDSLRDSEICLYDIDATRLQESKLMLDAINANVNDNRASIKCYLGVENRKEALRGANFAVNAIQVGGYEPCTVTDFEIPKKFGLLQTIGDSQGVGGIMRSLRTIPVLEDFARDMEEVCPDVLFLNYTNPMSALAGFMQRYTGIQTVGLCHSVQVCSAHLLKSLGMEDKIEGRTELIAGINHMGWLLEIKDKAGNDLYPEIRRRAAEKNATEKHHDMVRFEYIRRLGYYCTESSEHNAEYNPWFIKNRYPELIDKFNVPLDEYPRRCVAQIEMWEKRRDELIKNPTLTHERSREYASYIMDAAVNDAPIRIGGNVINHGSIENLPADACVEVPVMVDARGFHPTYVGKLPLQLAAMNMQHVMVQQLTIDAAVTKKRERIYQAVMMDPHAGAELSLDDIVKMVDELIDAHGDYLPKYN